MTAIVTGLNHVNLRAPHALLLELRDFYRDVVGLKLGPRPAFGSPGYWLYAGDVAVLHLSEQQRDEAPRGPVRADAPVTFDHVAFAAVEPEAAAAALRAHDVVFRVDRSAATRQHQFFFADPAGNGVELNFPYVDESDAR
jgi:catechol 2,3-dioxygenase-like lactoylglutathione lyase family enzyme